MASSCVVSPPPGDKTATSHSSSAAFASSSSSFAPRSSPFLTRSSSPSQLNLFSSRSSPPSASSPSPSTSSIDRPNPPRRSMSVTKQANNEASNNKKTCMCAPTTHPGSFRCSYHRRLAEQQKNRAASPSTQSSSTRLNLLRSAMKNSLVRIGGVDAELVKRTPTTLIRPSSHQLRRREAFQPRRSRLSIMSNAED